MLQQTQLAAALTTGMSACWTFLMSVYAAVGKAKQKEEEEEGRAGLNKTDKLWVFEAAFAIVPVEGVFDALYNLIGVWKWIRRATGTSLPPTIAAHREACENRGKRINLDKLQHGEINLSNQFMAARGTMCNYRPHPGKKTKKPPTPIGEQPSMNHTDSQNNFNLCSAKDPSISKLMSFCRCGLVTVVVLYMLFFGGKFGGQQDAGKKMIIQATLIKHQLYSTLQVNKKKNKINVFLGAVV